MEDLFYYVLIYSYALSLLFYFSDVVDASGKAKRTGAGLLVFVWVLQTLFFVYRLTTHLQVNVISLFEYLFFFSWLLVTTSLVMSRFFRVEYLVFCMNTIGFAILTLTVFSRPDAQLAWQGWMLARELLYIHLTLAAGAYAALTVSAIVAGMYIVQHTMLKGKRWSKAGRRLPSLQVIDLYSYRTLLIGTPLLFLSVVIAITSLLAEGKYELLVDWRISSNLIVLGFYVTYLLRRLFLLQSGLLTARWNLVAYGVLLLNLLLSALSGFSNWD